MTQARLLLVDDDEDFLKLFVRAVKVQAKDQEYEVLTASSAEEALGLLKDSEVDVVLTDVQMPGGKDGYALFESLAQLRPGLPVILMTAYGSVEKAVQAVKQGAYHYFEKPIHDQAETFWTVVEQAVIKRRLDEEVRRRQRLGPLDHEIVGRSRPIVRLLDSVAQVARTPATVLITGETGSGKELVARAVHRFSDRDDRPFLAVNCAALAKDLLESELFGHEKGAFTGAMERHPGIFERAEGGTLFLDEISELSPKSQAELLRVLDTRTFVRVGGQAEIKADFRLVCATNKDLKEMVGQGRFRQDLYYRLDVFPLTVPPLRERKEDIPYLVAHFLVLHSQRLNRPVKGLTNETMIFLHQYHWPGNVRELANLIERGVIAGAAQEITLKDVFPAREEAEAVRPVTSIKEMEKLMITLALSRAGGNKTAAAQMLGIGLKTLYQKIKRYGLE